MCPDQVDLIRRHAPGRQVEPAPVDDRQRYAAWKFYCTVLGGRQVWPFGVRDNGRLWFEVGNVVIETGPQCRDARARMAFTAEVVEDVAIRCWDAGFSVLVRERRGGRSSLTLIDPFGRQIDLVPSDQNPPEVIPS